MTCNRLAVVIRDADGFFTTIPTRPLRAHYTAVTVDRQRSRGNNNLPVLG